MDVGSVILGVGGLLTAAWATYLTSRTRTQSLRDVQYQRQVDLFIDLLQAASDLYGDIGSIIDAGGGDAQRVAVDHLVQTSNRHWPLQARLMALAPDAVVKAWRPVSDLVLRAIADSNDDAQLRRRFAEFEGAMSNLITSIREHLGTEPLAAETRALLRSIHSPP